VTVETLLSMSCPLTTCVPTNRKLPVWMRVYDVVNADVLS
jgi:hypothetical protein